MAKRISLLLATVAKAQTSHSYTSTLLVYVTAGYSETISFHQKKIHTISTFIMFIQCNKITWGGGGTVAAAATVTVVEQHPHHNLIIKGGGGGIIPISTNSRTRTIWATW